MGHKPAYEVLSDTQETGVAFNFEPPWDLPKCCEFQRRLSCPLRASEQNSCYLIVSVDDDACVFACPPVAYSFQIGSCRKERGGRPQ
jgi:hypothetical protein